MSDSRSTKRSSYAERKAARFQRRVEIWEHRLQSPPPPRFLHRATITIFMMLAMLGLLALLISSPGSS